MASLQDNVDDLNLNLSRSIRLCNSGRALARAAMVEAAYGGNESAMLKQVAQDIEDTVHSIYSNLKTIGSELSLGRESTIEKN